MWLESHKATDIAQMLSQTLQNRKKRDKLIWINASDAEKNLLQNILNAKQNIGKYNGNTHINRLIQFDPFNIIWWHGRKRVAGEDKKTASQHS